jgi:hypothetical protein
MKWHFCWSVDLETSSCNGELERAFPFSNSFRFFKSILTARHKRKRPAGEERKKKLLFDSRGSLVWFSLLSLLVQFFEFLNTSGANGCTNAVCYAHGHLLDVGSLSPLPALEA